MRIFNTIQLFCLPLTNSGTNSIGLISNPTNLVTVTYSIFYVLFVCSALNQKRILKRGALPLINKNCIFLYYDNTVCMFVDFTI